MARPRKPSAGPYACAFCERTLALAKIFCLIRHFKAPICYEKNGPRTTTCPACVRECTANAAVVYTKGDLVLHLQRTHSRTRQEVVPLDEDSVAQWSAQEEEMVEDYNDDVVAEEAEEAGEAMGQEVPFNENLAQARARLDELGLALCLANEPDHTLLPQMDLFPIAADSEEEVLAEVEIAAAQPDLPTELVYVDYRLHADSLREAVPLFRICLFVLEQRVSERTFGGFVGLIKAADPDFFSRQGGGIAKIPTSVKRLISKSQELLGSILKPKVFTASRLESSQPVAVLDPADAVASWLSLPEVLSALEQRSAASLGHFLAGTNPIQIAYASGDHPTVAETWHGTEYYDSVARARPFWEPRYVADRSCLFVHLGFFFDGFQAIERDKTGLIIMSLMGVSKVLADRLDLHLPLCLFREDKVVDPLEATLMRLKLQMEQLARGLDFTAKDGRQYRVFCVTSHLYGDIPAVREVAGLKRGNPNYPCPYCLLCADHTRSNEECVYRCASRAGPAQPPSGLVGVTFSPKTSAMYQQAFDAPFATSSTEQMCLWAGPPNPADPPSRRTGAAKHFRLFPGVSFPESLATDLMHNEFLGQSKTHLRLLLERIATAMEISEQELASRLSAKFGVVQKLNRSYVRFGFWDLNGVNYLSAAAVKKLVFWSMHLFRLIQVPLDDISLAPHLQAWQLRVATVSRLCRRSFTPAELRVLRHSLQELNQMCCTLYTRFCSIKTHLMKNHAVEIIKRLGPMTHYWSFRAESKIGKIKGIYANTNGHAVVESIFARAGLNIALQRILSYLGTTPFDDYQPRVSPGEYGIPVAGTFALRRGATFDHVLRIGEIAITLCEETAKVSRAPLRAIREQEGLLLIRGRDFDGEERIPITDLMPVDIVPYDDQDCFQVVGHEVYGLPPAPVGFLIAHPRPQQ